MTQSFMHRQRALTDSHFSRNSSEGSDCDLGGCAGMRVLVRRTFIEVDELDSDRFSSDPESLPDAAAPPKFNARAALSTARCTPKAQKCEDPPSDVTATTADEASESDGSCRGSSTGAVWHAARSRGERAEAVVRASLAEELRGAHAEEDRRTTLILKNLQASCTSSVLAWMLDNQGLKGLYDFVYVPVDLQKRAAFGYAFVNLVSHDAALRTMELLVGCEGSEAHGQIAIEVCWSDPHQGLELQVQRYRNSPLMHHSVPDDFRPLLFSGGARVPFPKPTKRIKAPSQRGRSILK